jgi:hypothetical protein
MMLTPVYILMLSFSLSFLAPTQGSGFCLPDAKLTPGRSFDVTAAELSKRGYKSPARKISIALKCQVYKRYRIRRETVGYNVDHLIPVRLGGSNSIRNLWPQPLSGEWCWHRKNKLERRLRKLVYGGQLDLKQAQQEIATDWVSAYKKYVGEPRQASLSQP